MSQAAVLVGKWAASFCVFFSTNFAINDIAESGISMSSLYGAALLGSAGITVFIEVLARNKRGIEGNG